MENENQVSPDDSQAKQQTHIIITPCPVNPPETVQPMNLKVPIFLHLKILTVILGTIITGVGGHAFFQSTWNRQYNQARERPEGSYVKLDHLFNMECIFVSITLIVYMWSIVNLMLTFDKDYKVGTNKWEKVFHVVAGIFLLIGGALNVYSATEVLNDKVFELVDQERSQKNYVKRLLTFDRNINQFYDAKIAAGCLSFANALLYFVTSRFVPKANA